MIRIGVIGYGYWGPNLARNFYEIESAELRSICEIRPDRRSLAANLYPGVNVTADYRDLLSDPALDAVAIATPLSSHYPLALEALQAGKHVLVEKPLAASADEAKHLMDEAARRQLVLMVDHTFVYSDAVRQIKKMIDAGDLGKIYYYDSVRINLGLFQHDTNVLWDLAAHDLAIMDYVLGAKPYGVTAAGVSHFQGQPENLAYLTCFFEDNMIGHIHVNWLAPVKVRNTLIGGEKKMVVYNDLETSEKLKVYDKGIILGEIPEYRTGDMHSPQINSTEALRYEIEHFIHCIKNGFTPITDGEAGLRVVQILEAATLSMKNRGCFVELSPHFSSR